MRDTVSVVIPVYNVERYIERCFNSIVSQTFQELEIIAVIDGSKDRSIDVVRRFARSDPRIKIIEQSNQGVGFARDNGLRAASGKYICFPDSDDWVAPGYIESFYLEAMRTNADVVIGAAFAVDNNERAFRANYVNNSLRYRDLPFHWSQDHSVFGVNTPVWDKFFRREFLLEKQLFFNMATAEDIAFKWKALLEAERISIVPDPFYYYRVRRTSATGGGMIAIEAFRAHDMVRSDLQRRGLYDLLYPVAAYQEVLESVYATFKAVPALLSNDVFYASYFSLLYKAMSRLDFDRARGALKYLPEEYLFRALLAVKCNDAATFRTYLRDFYASDSEPLQIALGRVSLEVSVRQQGGVHQPYDDAGLASRAFWAAASDFRCDPRVYPDMPEHSAGVRQGQMVSILAPPNKARSGPAVSTLSFGKDHGFARLSCLATAYQPERKCDLVVHMDVEDLGGAQEKSSDTVVLRPQSGPKVLTVGLPGPLRDKPFNLNLYAIPSLASAAYYTGIRLSHFHAAEP